MRPPTTHCPLLASYLPTTYSVLPTTHYLPLTAYLLTYLPTNSRLQVILSLEMHCNVVQQREIAALLVRHLGSLMLDYEGLIATKLGMKSSPPRRGSPSTLFGRSFHLAPRPQAPRDRQRKSSSREGRESNQRG